MMTITLGLTTILVIIGGVITTLTAIYQGKRNLGSGIFSLCIGAMLTGFLAPLIPWKIADNARLAVEVEKEAVYVAEQKESMPEVWQQIATFVEKEQSHATRKLVVSRFVEKGYGGEPAPSITLDQHRVFVDEMPCNGLIPVNCEKWKMWVAGKTCSLVDFDMQHVLLQNQAPPGLELEIHVRLLER